ncbi:MAG TPA: hypothetical protein VN181_08950, partial [Thermoanaerobaculia bacterium]|nr:hypothetical protein [Thermoanaerobaculia bacterium]
MAKNGAAEGRSRRFVPRGSRAAIVVTLVAVGIVAVMYYAYYRSQIAYYTGRNLRLLSMLSAQIEGRVDMFAGFVRSKAPEADVAFVDDCTAWKVSERIGIEEV